MTIDPEKLFYWVLGNASVCAVGFIAMIRRIDTKASRAEMDRRFDQNREEQRQNLERRDTRLREEMSEILKRLDKQDTESGLHRKLMTDKLDHLREDMAVLKDRALRRRPQ